MSRKTIALGIAIVVLVFAGYATWSLATSDTEERSGARLGRGSSDAADDREEGAADADGGSEGSTDSSGVPEATDAVPMELVDELFTSLDEMGLKPSMNQTFTVEYAGSFERVRVTGVFEDEGTRTIEFALTDDEAWEIVEDGQ